MNGKWSAEEPKVVYEADWMTVATAGATLPDGTHVDHHIVTCGEGGANVLAHDPEKGILLIWRHRLITDAWGWELPGGRIEKGEKPQDAAAREFQEETGWKAGELRPLARWYPISSFIDHSYNAFVTDSATWVGPEPDVNEVGDLCWMPVDQVRVIVEKGEILDGFTYTALLRYFFDAP